MPDFRPIEFTVPGEPQGKGRPRIGRVGNHARMFTPAKTVAYEGLVALAAQEAMAGRELLTGPVMIELEIFHGVPQSMSKKRKGIYPADKLAAIKAQGGSELAVYSEVEPHLAPVGIVRG